MTKIFCFGNEFFEQDSLAKTIADEIKVKGIEFVRCNAPDDLIHYEDLSNIILLDVVKGIDNVMLITDPDVLKHHDSVSAHDIDLGFYLKLLKEIGKVKNVKIIGIPQKGDKQEIKKQVLRLLKINL